MVSNKQLSFTQWFELFFRFYTLHVFSALPCMQNFRRNGNQYKFISLFFCLFFLFVCFFTIHMTEKFICTKKSMIDYVKM